MRCLPAALLLLLYLPIASYAQDTDEQASLDFCGLRYKNTKVLKKYLAKELAFLNIQEGDTIVDIGASSGAFAGALSVLNTKKNIHFVLVDIDTACLNQRAVNNMLQYFETLKKSPLHISTSIINNTEDSLYLPPAAAKKMWIINTLHEIPDKLAIARQIVNALDKNGELVVAELLATAKQKIHNGCKKRLFSEEEIINIFVNAGLRFKESANTQVTKQKDKHPYCFFRFIKE